MSGDLSSLFTQTVSVSHCVKFYRMFGVFLLHKMDQSKEEPVVQMQSYLKRNTVAASKAREKCRQKTADGVKYMFKP